jgi:hypothetical protein
MSGQACFSLIGTGNIIVSGSAKSVQARIMLRLLIEHLAKLLRRAPFSRSR